MADLVTQIEALEGRAEYAERRLRHCKQWYAERIERLTAYAKDKGIWPDIACIIANGSLSDGTRYDPPTYAQQLNTAIHRAEAAEERASKLQGDADEIARLREALGEALENLPVRTEILHVDTGLRGASSVELPIDLRDAALAALKGPAA